MIGYITVYQPDMKFRDYYRYREYYCGLCRTLGRRRGQTARITLGYDMTFLAVLLDGVYDSATESREFRCPAHPLGKRKALNNVFVDYAADMNLYMAWLKCLDDWRDDRNLLRGAYARFLSRRIRRIEEEYRDKTEVINAALEDLNRLEQEQSSDFESAAGCFGRAVSELFRYGEIWGDQLAEMGFYIGKYVYLLDAYEDLEMDLEKKRYNPFRKMSGEERYHDRVREILASMIAKSAEVFEMLPVDENMDILRNILYAGAWNRFEEIREKKDPSRQPVEKTKENNLKG